MNDFVNMMDQPSLPTSLEKKGNIVSKLSSISVLLFNLLEYLEVNFRFWEFKAREWNAEAEY